MSGWDKPCTKDGRLREIFGVPVRELYDKAAAAETASELTRVVELRTALAWAEEQVARIRDRVYQATAPDRDMDTLSAEALRLDALWLDPALTARNGYLLALDDLLNSTPSLQELGRRSGHSVQHKAAAPPPPTPPAPVVGSTQAGRISRVRKSGIA